MTIYVVSTWVGLRVFRTSSSVGLIWPATGVLVGALLVVRDLHWGVVATAAWAGAALLQLAIGVHPGVAVTLSGLGVLEAVLVASFLLRFPTDVRHLANPSSLFVLTGVAALTAAALGLPAAPLLVLPDATMWAAIDAWLVWTWGHAIGVLLFTTVWLAWSRPDLVWSQPATPVRVVEAVAALACIMVATTLVFFDGVGHVDAPALLSRPHQVLPFAVWVALRLGPRGTSVTMVLVTLIAVLGTAVSGGAFTNTHPAADQRVLLTQGFVLSLTLGGMALAIAIERVRSQEYQGRMLNVALAEANEVLVHEIAERERTALSLRMLLDATPEGIVVVDAEGTIVEVNDAIERMFGYTRLQLIGHRSEKLVVDAERSTLSTYRQRYAGAPERMQAHLPGRDLLARRADGATFPAQVMLSPYHVGDALRIIAAVRDVTSQRAAERQMAASLREKEVLLREVHHRVKNNMAVMSSLFYLQSRHATDPETVSVFRESESRVRSMAMVHEVLYRSDDLSAVDFSRYLASLVEHLASVYRATVPGLQLHADIQPIRLSIEQAVPCGLLLNEVLTNVFKHAFVERDDAALRVDAWSRRGEIAIEVIDNGVGMPEEGHAHQPHTLGVRLMQALTEQLDGTLITERQARGTRTRLAFPLVVGAPVAAHEATQVPA